MWMPDEVKEFDQRSPSVASSLGFALEMSVGIGDAPSEWGNSETGDSSSEMDSSGEDIDD